MSLYSIAIIVFFGRIVFNKFGIIRTVPRVPIPGRWVRTQKLPSQSFRNPLQRQKNLLQRWQFMWLIRFPLSNRDLDIDNWVDKAENVTDLLFSQLFLFVSSPAWTRSTSSPLHSVLNWLAPVRLPSPPITHRLVMPSFTRLQAAFIRPSLALKSLQRALPMTVPP